MRRALLAAAVVLIFAPYANAQTRGDRPQKRFRTEQKIGRLMDSLREEMWAYRQELEPFRGTPDYPELIESRFRLRNLAIRVADLEKGGDRAQRAQRELSREMRKEAQELKRRTGRLEDRADQVAGKNARRLADRLKERADDIEAHITRLDELVR
jgi:hypothetical protein